MQTPASVLAPAGFHGSAVLRRRARGGGIRRSYFEGWYVKLVSADRSTRLAVIPGMFLSEDGSVAEAFVQVLDGISGTTAYHRFPLSDFGADPRRFDVRVGANRFDADGIVVDLPGLRAEVRFGPGVRWPVTVREPGAMGWYAWVPTMECYHGVLSLDHALGGWVDTGGGPVDLEGGRGYLEKDWGTAFPKAYVWMQSNHFEVGHAPAEGNVGLGNASGQLTPDAPGVSLVASTALIPWRRSTFRGDLVALHLPDGPRAGLHRFTSYTRARTTELAVDDERVRWSLRSPAGDTLDLVATVGGRMAGLLHSPVRTEMHQRVAETLDGTVEVRLADASGRMRFEGIGQCAGVEVHGAIDELLATAGRQGR